MLLFKEKSANMKNTFSSKHHKPKIECKEKEKEGRNARKM